MSKILNIALVLGVIAIGYGLTLFLDYARPPPEAQKNTSAQHITLSAKKTAQTQSKVVPDFSFSSLSGASYKISDFTGKTVILNFWASWCVPCIKEFPLLLQAAQAYPKDLVLIALSSDKSNEAIKRFLNKMEKQGNAYWKAPNVIITLDENNVTQELFQTYRLPETILIDKSQIMRKKLVGADWTFSDLQSYIKDLSRL